MPTYSDLNLFGKVAGPFIIACMCVGLFLAGNWIVSGSVEHWTR